MTTLITKDEVLKMAVQAGATEIGHKPPAFHFYLENLEAFAKLVADKATEREREACAKVCEQRAKEFHALFRKYKHEEDAGANMGATQCMDLIRARGTEA